MIKKKLSSPPVLRGYNFSPEKAREARDLGKLLSMRTETSLLCNLRCRYCNGTSGVAPEGEISFGQIKDVVSQVKDLGGESVVVIGGGEPTIYPKFRELITYIHGLGMVPVVITNTLTMSRDLASFLYEQDSSVLTKLDSLREDVQDFLGGIPGTYKRIREGLDNLLSVGFADEDIHELRLGASFVTTALTVGETPDIWRFCRDYNIYPNQEELVPRGRALESEDTLTPTLEDLQRVKKDLLKIDEEEYGHTWIVHAPLTGHGCLQHMYSVYLTSMGYVRPCSDVDVKLFHIDNMSIAEIIQSPFFQIARHIEDHLTGKCGECEYTSRECIGCRGIAFSTGINEGLDIYEAIKREDPLCGK